MTPLHRSTHSDSKKSSFAILWFFYDLLLFFKVSAKLKAIKEKHICIEDPKLFSNTDSSEQVLIGTIHMSLGFTDRPFPFVKFDREALDCGLNREDGWARDFRQPWLLPASGKRRRSTKGLALMCGVVQLGLRWPVLAWPQQAVAQLWRCSRWRAMPGMGARGSYGTGGGTREG
jgi:hypothetical protein